MEDNRRDEEKRERQARLDERRDHDRARQEEQTGQTQEQIEQQESAFHDEGYDTTEPGQNEVIAGSVEHIHLLKSYPNATSYAGEVNIVLPPEEEEGEGEEGEGEGTPPQIVDTPLVERQVGIMACTTGTWDGEPTEYHYEWTRNGSEIIGDDSDVYTLTEEDNLQTLSCTVTAVNEHGETTAPPSNGVYIDEQPPSRTRGR